jgi:hypothetical protein
MCGTSKDPCVKTYGKPSHELARYSPPKPAPPASGSKPRAVTVLHSPAIPTAFLLNSWPTLMYFMVVSNFLCRSWRWMPGRIVCRRRGGEARSQRVAGEPCRRSFGLLRGDAVQRFGGDDRSLDDARHGFVGQGLAAHVAVPVDGAEGQRRT